MLFLATPVQSLPGLTWPQPSGLGLSWKRKIRSEKNKTFCVSVRNACKTDPVLLRFALKRNIFWAKPAHPTWDPTCASFYFIGGSHCYTVNLFLKVTGVIQSTWFFYYMTRLLLPIIFMMEGLYNPCMAGTKKRRKLSQNNYFLTLQLGDSFFTQKCNTVKLPVSYRYKLVKDQFMQSFMFDMLKLFW